MPASSLTQPVASEPTPEPEPAPANTPEQPIELSLDDDPDTSLVGSIYLHLLSEHNCYGALRLDDDTAIAAHVEMHSAEGQNHDVADWRFRPGRALAASMRGTELPTT